MVAARPPTILCVDDKAGTLAIRKHLLEQAGYLVVPATDASTALKLFKSRIIDLVISDHLLPDFTGAELTGEMKRQRPFVPVMIYSGVIDAPPGTEHVDLFTSEAAGPNELLEKVAELLRPNRIAGGNYFAEIRCDRRSDPLIWHYTVQRLRSPEILAWCQAATEKEAIRDAKRALRELNERPAAS